MAGMASSPIGWSLAGYDLLEPLGHGGAGDVWLAIERATGERVAVKRLRTDGDSAGDREALARLGLEAAALGRVRHPHLLRLREVVADGDRVVLVLDLAAGGSLGQLVAARGRLAPGEVVTVLVPLAEALASVHEHGLVHGDVTPANVLFDADGRPLLADLGVARVVGVPASALHGTTGFLDPAADPGPAGDVHGLAATCWAALTGQAPYDALGRRRPHPQPNDPVASALLQALDLALCPHPDARPPATELARAAYDVTRPVPVRLVPAHQRSSAEGAEVSEVPVNQLAVTRRRPRPVEVPVEVPGDPAKPPRRGRRRRTPVRRRRPLLWWVGGVTLAVSVSGLGWGWATVRPDPAQQQSWPSVLAGLDEARSVAFAAGDPQALGEVYVPGSPALARDRALLRRLTTAGLRARGLRLTTDRVDLVGRTPDRARLRVVDRMSPYAVVDASGEVLDRRLGRGPATWRVTLREVGGRWLIADVQRLA